ncbi:molybdopterin cofactor-binding domain-containing protein [Parvularcula marina]|uniref:xanthine dehydrogenase family protein molybdopterin-binding subunit n=1 Tax=Parvularcula marina TaxID=2292771 RepID=UPI00351372C3
MALAVDIARRTFLVGSLAVSGGVVFGIYKYKSPMNNPLEDDLGEGEAALTPYVRLDAAGVTLITPRTDLGQGAYSIQAAMIAEELDIELDQVRVDPGPPDAIYYNTALAREAAPFRATDDSFAAETVRSTLDAVMKFVGMQITGGSTTVPDGFVKLRIAGAVARETLKAAAAKKARVPVRELKTTRGAVELPDGTTIGYGELAEGAAKIRPVTNVKLRDPSQWRLLGKPMRRHDIVAKSTGTQDYGIDQRLDGMLHAAVRINPHQGAGVKSHDASAAEKMRGVLKVLPVTGGFGVIADNTWRAIKAAEAIEVEWEEAAYPAEMDGHWEALAASFNKAHLDKLARDDGDVDKALDAAESIHEAEYRAPYLAHAPMEPINATVLVGEDGVDVWTATQIPRFVEQNVARIAGVDIKKVRVHVLMAGGSFGHRLEDEVVKQATELAVQLKGTPIKLTYSREEDMIHDFPRQIAMGRMRGAVKDGHVDSYDLGITMPSVISSQMGRQGFSVPGPDSVITSGAWDQPYNIPNYRMSGYRAPELAPVSSWRSVGASTNGFFHDCFLDELIHEAGADPLEERLRLMWHEPSRKTLEAVGEMSGWGSPMEAGRGRGVAFCLSFGTPVAEVVEVTDTGHGIRIDKVYVAAEVGRVVDPVNFENLVQGGVIWALGHAMNCEITYSGGRAQQTNFHQHEGMRLYQCPEIIVRGLENGEHVRGIGEPPVPPAAPALANAIFAATGKRIREMPFNKHISFV